jgi:hypothetical protein
VTEDVFARELDRVADRLRVLGPRLAARPGDRLGRIRTDLQRLADLAADVEGQPRRSVPALAPHALADQALVLGHDLLATGDPAGLAAGTDLLTGLRRAL